MASNLVNLSQFKSNNPLQTYTAAQQYIEGDAKKVRAAIGKNENEFNYNLQQPWESFKQAYPETTFQDAEEYQTFKDNYDPNKPMWGDFLKAYGQTEAIKILNRTGISPMWLGADANEVREFDLNTAKWNPEINEFEVFARVADKQNNRSFTAPITRFGKKVKDLFTGGGKEAVEQEAIDSLPISAFENMYQGAKYATGRYLEDTGMEYLAGNPKAKELEQLNFFDTSAPARGEREDWLFSLGTELITDLSGVQQTPSPTDAPQTPSTETVTPTSQLSPEDLAKVQYSGRGSLPRRQDMSEGLKNYIYPGTGAPFGMNQEEFESDKYSDAQRSLMVESAKKLSAKNIQEAIAFSLDPYFGPIDDIKATYGKRSVEESETRKNTKEAYTNVLTEKVLTDAFTINPKKFQEFQADPVAFANKYKNNISALKGTPVSPKQSTEISEGSPFKLNEKDLTGLNDAIKNNNLSAFTSILNTLTKDKDVPEAQQQKIVKFLGQANNFVRTGNQRKLNHAIVLDMWASLNPQERNTYASSLMRFAETGYLTFEGVEQARKMSAEQRAVAAAQKPGPMSDVTKGFQGFIDQMASPDFDFTTQAGIGEQIRALSNQIQTEKDLVAFTDAAGVYLKRLVEAEGQPGFFDELLSFGQAKGPAAASFSLKPDVVAFDKADNVTNDPAKAAYFAPMDSGGKAIRGSAITKDQVLEIAGAPAIPLLMAVSTQNMKFRGQG